MYRIFLTGSSGFIGKNIIEILGDRYNFLFPSSKELNLLDSSSVRQYLKKYQPDIIIHTANVGGVRNIIDQPGTLQKNLTMFHNLCAAKEYFNRMIVLGSGAEYDKRRGISLIKESQFGEITPADEYGLSKFTMSQYAEGVDFITHLRLFGVYGKYEDYKIRFISNTICKTLFDLPLTINQNVFFDYLYINDFVKILEYFINNHAKEKFFNVGNGTPVDLLNIASKVISLVDKKLPITVIKKGLGNDYTCNVEKLKKEIISLQFTEFDDTIKDLVVYYKSILTELNKDLFLKDA